MVLIQQIATIESTETETEILKAIEEAGRTCYKSESRITEDSAADFFRKMLKSGHYSVIEHGVIRVRFITNRGVTHELVRHRLASYSQESTRYCNYGGKDIQFIKPTWWGVSSKEQRDMFMRSLELAEASYNRLLELGWQPQQAREVLPNALKTEIVMTANIREWYHVLKLRCSKAAHPQIKWLMIDLLILLRERYPIMFGPFAGTVLAWR
jgi:thymidylate synthase (FAD)